MNWFIQTIETPVGKKLLMSITGLFFCMFLMIHLIGNLTLYAGQDTFNSYVDHLHALGILINIAEVCLLFSAAVHVFTGIRLFLGNWKARPKRYALYQSSGGRTIGSATMPYTGIILLFFIVIHLIQFHFADHGIQTVFQIVSGAFSNPINVLIYIVASFVAGLHVSHGLWSAVQTLGINHSKYIQLIYGASLALSLCVAIGFGFIPVYIVMMT
ncbi:MAG: succinate dehydrogenase cytochrome b subunit [Desulfobacterales bacterium]|nr:succinate dehydrogenase cytochrome b subunit [Desulfobacterales bacterium]